MIGSRLLRQVQVPRCFSITMVIAIVMTGGCEQSSPVTSGGLPGPETSAAADKQTTAEVPDEIPVVTPTPESTEQPDKPDPAGDTDRPRPPVTPDSPGEAGGKQPGNSPPPTKPEESVDVETTSAALLELSQEFLDAKNTKQARFWLEHITKEFPGTKAATRAAALLKSLAG